MSEILLKLADLFKGFDPFVICKHRADVDSEEEEDDNDYVDELPESFKQPESKKGSKRASVSCECTTQNTKKFIPPKNPKTEEQMKKLEDIMRKSFLFSTLDTEQLNIAINALKERRLNNGETIIKQNDDGDLLYIVEKGVLECYKKMSAKDPPRLVKKCMPGDAFGELALLYNCPRAASVVAAADCVVWELDRETFSHIVKDSAADKRDQYQKFLKSVSLFKNMDDYEVSQVADALKQSSYSAGTYIMKQGDKGDKFYIVQVGTCVAKKSTGSTVEEVVLRYSPGDYFGELALLRNEPRAASVVATSDVKLLALDRNGFERLLGPLQDIMDREGVSRYH